MNISQLPLILIYLCSNSQHFESSLVFNSLWTHVSDQGRAQKKWQMWFLRVEKRCLLFFIFYALSKILNTSKDKSIASTMHFITTQIWALAEPSKVSVLFTVFWTFLWTFDFPASTSWSSKHVFLVLPHRQLQDQVLWLWQVQKYKNKKMPNTPTSPA